MVNVSWIPKLDALSDCGKEVLPLRKYTVKLAAAELFPVSGVSSSKSTPATSAGGVPLIVRVIWLSKKFVVDRLMLPLVPVMEIVV